MEQPSATFLSEPSASHDRPEFERRAEPVRGRMTSSGENGTATQRQQPGDGPEARHAGHDAREGPPETAHESIRETRPALDPARREV